MVTQKGLRAANAPAATLIAELRQPLAASTNYIAAARLLLQMSENQKTREAMEYLEKADEQILRAGEIMRRLRSEIAGERPSDSLSTSP